MRSVKKFMRWYIEEVKELIADTLYEWEIAILKMYASDLRYQEEMWFV